MSLIFEAILTSATSDGTTHIAPLGFRREGEFVVLAPFHACGRLESALSHIELEVARIEEDPLRPRFLCRELLARNHAPFPGHNRAQAAVIEACILVSRLNMLPADKVQREMDSLAIAIDKTAGPRELEAWGWLREKIAAHREAA